MLRQFRTLYPKFNVIIHTFSHCTKDVKLLLIRATEPLFIVDICGQIIRKLRTANYELLLIMCIDEY